MDRATDLATANHKQSVAGVDSGRVDPVATAIISKSTAAAAVAARVVAAAVAAAEAA